MLPITGLGITGHIKPCRRSRCAEIGRQLLWVALSLAGLLANAEAQSSPWRPHHRIAVTADGNPGADPDDIGATPMTLAVLAKAGLQDELVHYDFNNWLEYKKIPAHKNAMWVGAMGGQARWGFDRSRFFDVSHEPEQAIANLVNEINRSTASDPLYVIAAGPLEFLYRCAEKARRNALAHVTIVSHSGYNDYYKPRLWQRISTIFYGCIRSQPIARSPIRTRV